MTPEVISRLTLLKHKANDGSATIEEYREAVKIMREDRMNASTASVNSTKRAKKPKAEVKSADEMLDELGGI